MKISKIVWFVIIGTIAANTAQARGVLIPEDKLIPPFVLTAHHAKIQIEDQLVKVRLEQVFENPSSRNLEATYWFPVPKGAAVNGFFMWVDGKEVKGELLDATKARETYQNIVRRTMDPGLLEYMDAQWIRLRVFPVPAKGRQKVALEYLTVASREQNVVEMNYPWKNESRNHFQPEDFSLNVQLKSKLGIGNVYSPSHAILVDRKSGTEAELKLEKSRDPSPRDFQLYYTLSSGDEMHFQPIWHRIAGSEDGYFAFLISPSFPKIKRKPIPRDMVFVMDTSGSMRGPKMDQAKKALKFCLGTLNSEDRFAVINFATAVNAFRPDLVNVQEEMVREAKAWVDSLDSTGGTAIHDALMKAFEMRKAADARPFIVVFFTDGLPTVGTTDPEKILQGVQSKMNSQTRVFTFGVGDDVNAVLLDSIAEKSRAVATYVRPSEDIEQKVSSMVSKIQHPAMVQIKMKVEGSTRLSEVFPKEIPDLYEGSQVVVFGRYQGYGKTRIALMGKIGEGEHMFHHDFEIPEKTDGTKRFLEPLWARKKVAFLLDQIRANGEKKELVDEVVSLSLRHGITTPYTSYLVVPDGPVYLPPEPRPIPYPMPRVPQGLLPADPKGQMKSVLDFARENQNGSGQFLQRRAQSMEMDLARQTQKGGSGGIDAAKKLEEISALNKAKAAMNRDSRAEVQAGRLGVELSIQSQNLRQDYLPSGVAVKVFQGRKLFENGGIWVDESFKADVKSLIVKSQSRAYFQLLESRPELKELFLVSNYLVWMTPGGTALVIDATQSREDLVDLEINDLFKNP